MAAKGKRGRRNGRGGGQGGCGGVGAEGGGKKGRIGSLFPIWIREAVHIFRSPFTSFFFSPIQQLELFSSPVTALKGKFFLMFYLHDNRLVGEGGGGGGEESHSGGKSGI